ncbi:TerD family protein, partial [Streptomyces fuscigenes]|uniref:TerD family protein n=1 Tax=Streptomyces fuscigenes TaxID=1528880 RepID=UPI001F16D39E
MAELVPGGNLELPNGAVVLRVPGPFDVSALVTGDDRRVGGDADFVFFNQPHAPGVDVDSGAGVSTVRLDPRRLRPGATRVTLVLSPADPGTPLGALPAPVLSVRRAAATGAAGSGAEVAVFRPPRPDRESVLLLAEVYRRGGAWKVRALGQGYADGLAGLARDFGVDVEDDGTPAAPPPRAPAAPQGDPEGYGALVGAERMRAGAPPVALDARLREAAARHAAAMAAEGALAVETSDGVSLYQRVEAAGFSCLALAEHLVSGPHDPAAFLAYCLSAPATAAPFADPAYTHVGIGRAAGRSGEVFWTAVWASPFSPAGLARLTADVVRLTAAERAAAGL